VLFLQPIFGVPVLQRRPWRFVQMAALRALLAGGVIIKSMHLRRMNTVGHSRNVSMTVQPTNPFIHAKHGNNQSGLSLCLRFTFRFAFACFRSFGKFAHPSSLSRLSKSSHVRISLGRSSPRGGSCPNVRGSPSTHPHT